MQFTQVIKHNFSQNNRTRATDTFTMTIFTFTLTALRTISNFGIQAAYPGLPASDPAVVEYQEKLNVG